MPRGDVSDDNAHKTMMRKSFVEAGGDTAKFPAWYAELARNDDTRDMWRANHLPQEYMTEAAAKKQVLAKLQELPLSKLNHLAALFDLE